MTERSTNTWLSVSAYSRAYGVDRRTVYKWLDSGLLDSYRVPPRLIRIKNQPPKDSVPQSVSIGHGCSSLGMHANTL